MWKCVDEKLAISQKHAALSWQALGVWVYILPQTDGRGRFLAEPDFLRSTCMTLRRDLRLGQVEKAIEELEVTSTSRTGELAVAGAGRLSIWFEFISRLPFI